MPCSPQLPQWVSYLQALAVPIFAGFGVWIAAQQMVIADDKLRLDAFDRQYSKRVAVYEATRNILEQVFRNTLSEDDVRVYGVHALDAQFLFDDDVFKYLQQLRYRIGSWVDIQTNLGGPINIDERSEYERIAKENLDWIIKQGDPKTGFSARFAPFLIHTPVERPSWLRWP
jgi:hypothetical protein